MVLCKSATWPFCKLPVTTGKSTSTQSSVDIGSTKEEDCVLGFINLYRGLGRESGRKLTSFFALRLNLACALNRSQSLASPPQRAATVHILHSTAKFEFPLIFTREIFTNDIENYVFRGGGSMQNWGGMCVGGELKCTDTSDNYT